MSGRDPREQGRSSTPLELFFDLVAVVAVALAADRLHHAYVDGLGIETVVSFALVFFGVWWAWASYTWFASAYDNDDVVFRVATFVIMAGALVLAAGVPQVFDERIFTLAVSGYVIMRLALVTQLVRVMRDDPAHRGTTERYAIGVTACQLGWLTLLFVPGIWPIAWAILVPAELLVPVWAQRAGRLPFHNEHLTERYGLFMIIVLGESILAGSIAIQSAFEPEFIPLDLIGVIVGGLLIVFAMWWIYFDRPAEHLLDSFGAGQAWTYLHLLIFMAVAAVGAGLVVGIDEAIGHSQMGWIGVGMAVAVPLAVFMIALLLIYVRAPLSVLHRLILPGAAVAVLAAAFAPMPILAIGLVTSVTVALKVWIRVRDGLPAVEPAVASESNG